MSCAQLTSQPTFSLHLTEPNPPDAQTSTSPEQTAIMTQPSDNTVKFQEPKQRPFANIIDPEKGFADKEGAEAQNGPGGTGEMNEEYTSLVRYISTYRDGRRKSTASELGMDDDPVKRPWWAFWRGRGKKKAVDGNFEVPDDWLDTELRQGLSSIDVENRRKKTGFNELTTEKENM